MRMKKTGNENQNPEDLKKLLRMLEPEKVKKDWEQFALHFNEVHDDFLVAIQREFPNLTSNEIKLCAYLRLNLSSKEIAHIMNITVKSVELSRYRLRKKLQLPPEANLFNFLLKIHNGSKEPSWKRCIEVGSLCTWPFNNVSCKRRICGCHSMGNSSKSINRLYYSYPLRTLFLYF
jgi:DNA-binding CsgD family transcriptional regulator